MAEEHHRCHAPQLCANNCGFFGSPATLNLCSKCYRDLQLEEQQSSSAKLALDQTLLLPSSSPPPLSSIITDEPASSSPSSSEPPSPSATVVAVNRCLTCRKRVRLTGFKCRCGSMFCGTHRYPEQHNCSFDFKEMGKDLIAKANPVVKGQKLNKI